ncbi:LysR substrate-binding domain-containing protein [Microbacterium flavescens]|uniref:LysR substrate-binding domain-containing protein n=1 Tax=Microbacterium flavescens TaxID=69366 RepID=UPI001BDE4380|nr:LysR substrate-binding domain-containing protein [Microbacterium flavescens]BFF09171.1 LysR substrate-binding domain-containing protein [Microbacterium flavescens]
MARSGGSHARPGKSGRDASPRRSGKGAKPGPSGGRAGSRPRAKTPPAPKPEAPAEPPITGPFRLGAIPGATPGKWISAWRDRLPEVELELVPLEVSDQRRALIDGEVDAALVRLPIERDGLHVIALYDETPVVVVGADSHLTAADDLGLEDLGGEVVIAARDDVLGIRVPDAVAPAFAPPADTAEAIATVAAGVGVVVVPMSLARLHQRKDVEHRPLRDGPTSTVALAWVADRTTPAVDAFVGIVRGRTANSSRG